MQVAQDANFVLIYSIWMKLWSKPIFDYIRHIILPRFCAMNWTCETRVTCKKKKNWQKIILKPRCNKQSPNKSIPNLHSHSPIFFKPFSLFFIQNSYIGEILFSLQYLPAAQRLSITVMKGKGFGIEGSFKIPCK